MGDLVYRLDSTSVTGQSRKLKPIYVGPLVVTKVISPILYQLEDRKRTYVLHHDRLRYCDDRSIPLWIRRKRHQILDQTAALNDTIDLESSRIPATQDDQSQTADQYIQLPLLADEDDFNLQSLFDPNYTQDDVQPLVDLPSLEDEEDLGIQQLFDPVVTRHGRTVRRPRYLQDYED